MLSTRGGNPERAAGAKKQQALEPCAQLPKQPKFIGPGLICLGGGRPGVELRCRASRHANPHTHPDERPAERECRRQEAKAGPKHAKCPLTVSADAPGPWRNLESYGETRYAQGRGDERMPWRVEEPPGSAHPHPECRVVGGRAREERLDERISRPRGAGVLLSSIRTPSRTPRITVPLGARPRSAKRAIRDGIRRGVPGSSPPAYAPSNTGH